MTKGAVAMVKNANEQEVKLTAEQESDFNNKILTNEYEKHGFIVKTYKPDISEKERMYKDAKIKHDILTIVKNLKMQKHEN